MKNLLFAATVFMAVSAGPFGIEKTLHMMPVVHVVCVIMVATMFFLGPTAIMTVEMIERKKTKGPDGGAISWVEEAFGSHMGVIHGVILLMALAVDSATYPHLLAENMGIENNALLTIVPVAISAAVGSAGFMYTGAYALAHTCITLSPFVALFILTPWRDMYSTGHYVPENKIEYTFLARECLVIVMWNVTGFNMIATYAHSIHKNNVAVISILTVIFVVEMYIMSVCQASYYIHEKSEWTWEVVGHAAMRNVGEVWMTVASVASTLGALCVEIYAISNLWAGLVRLRVAPKCITSRSMHIVVTSTITLAVSAFFGFEEIVDMSVMLNSAVFIIQAAAWCDIMGKGTCAWRMVMALSIMLISLSTIACNTFWCIYSLLAVLAVGSVVALVVEIRRIVIKGQTSL